MAVDAFLATSMLRKDVASTVSSESGRCLFLECFRKLRHAADFKTNFNIVLRFFLVCMLVNPRG